MKKLFALLCAMLLAVQFASAQKNVIVLSKSGDLAAYPVSQVKFEDILTFTINDATSKTDDMFESIFSVAFKSDEYKSFEKTPEVGICFSDIHKTPTVADGRRWLGAKFGEQSFQIHGLDAGTTYYYRAYVRVNSAVCYSEVKSVTTTGEKPDDYIIINDHKFIDLGLSSGLLWATCNIDAATPADRGEYFAWGETKPKAIYNWSTYAYGTSADNITKYNSTDGKTTLDNTDDAAYVYWGTSCRMPTGEELTELNDSCTWTWTSVTDCSGNAVGGYQITGKNSKSIFLPVGGYLSEGSYVNRESFGDYWTSTLYSSNNYEACYLHFVDIVVNQAYNHRYLGLPIRPVATR